MNRYMISAIFPVVLSAIAPATAQTTEGARDFAYYHGPGMMWGGGQWGGFGMALGPIFMVLLLIGLVAGTVYLLRQFVPGSHGAAPAAVMTGERPNSAISILKERFARGEIDSKEFDERRRLLLD